MSSQSPAHYIVIMNIIIEVFSDYMQTAVLVHKVKHRFLCSYWFEHPVNCHLNHDFSHDFNSCDSIAAELQDTLWWFEHPVSCQFKHAFKHNVICNTAAVLEGTPGTWTIFVDVIPGDFFNCSLLFLTVEKKKEI